LQVGTFPNVTLVAADPYGLTGSASFSITVVDTGAYTFHVIQGNYCPCDGHSWQTAFPTFAQGLAALRDNKGDTLQVAQGSYLEQDLRVLAARAVVLGGYVSSTGMRDPVATPSVIAAPAKNSDSLLAIVAANVTADGFTLTGARQGVQVLVVDGAG